MRNGVNRMLFCSFLGKPQPKNTLQFISNTYKKNIIHIAKMPWYMGIQMKKNGTSPSSVRANPRQSPEKKLQAQGIGHAQAQAGSGGHRAPQVAPSPLRPWMDAEKSESIQKEFLTLMSQEMRTPLNSIMGMLQLLLFTEQDEEQKEYTQIAYDSSKVLLGHINDILDLSQLFAGARTLQPIEFDLGEICQSIIGTYKTACEEKGLGISLDIEQGLNTLVYADANRLRQILSNLVDNAVKFTHKGEVGMQLSHLGSAETKPGSTRILFIVSDTGVGIEESKLQLVDQAFIQGDSPYTRRYQGLGIGLTLVKRLMDIMGGNMSIESDLGVGTNVYFSMEFPLAAGQSVSEEEVSTTPAASSRILVVEDNKLNRHATVRLLEQAGYTAHGVEDGFQALDRLAEETYDAVLMDVQMPGMDGVETTRRIRTGASANTDKGIPIIAFTAHTQPEDRQHFLAAGMDDFLAKPVEQEDLNRTIQRALDKRRSGQAQA